jgi:hypothetical protein
MIPVSQTLFGKGGNCLAASIASMLNLSIGDIPKFETMSKPMWKIALIKWLNSLGYIYSEGFYPLEHEYCLAIVKSRDPAFTHCVVWLKDNVAHDPGTSEIIDYVPIKYLYITPLSE